MVCHRKHCGGWEIPRQTKKYKIFLFICFQNENLAEWESRSGTFVALGNKMYQGFDLATESAKKSTKGIPHRFNSSMETWLSALLGRFKIYFSLIICEVMIFEPIFDNSFPKQQVDMTSLRLNRNKEMSRMSMKRSNLSDIFLKMQVQDDKVTCTPLRKNNEYL